MAPSSKGGGTEAGKDNRAEPRNWPTSVKQSGCLNMFRVFKVFGERSPNTLNTSHFTDEGPKEEGIN
jgi:hypothetical protein